MIFHDVTTSLSLSQLSVKIQTGQVQSFDTITHFCFHYIYQVDIAKCQKHESSVLHTICIQQYEKKIYKAG